MKSILYLRTDLGTKHLTTGGSVTHTLGVLRAFIGQKTTVYCASSAVHGLLSKEPGIEFRSLAMPKWLFFIGFKLNCLLSNIFFFITTLIFLRNKTVTHIYQRSSMLNMVGVLLSWYKKIPLILEFNSSEVWVDANWASQKKSRIRLPLSWLIKKCELSNLRHAKAIVVVSDQLKENLIKMDIPSRKILVNPNGVDTDLFNLKNKSKERAQIRIKHDIEGLFVVGFIGTFSYWHGIETIKNIILSFAKKRSPIHFLLMGSGPLKNEIKEAIGKNNANGYVTFIDSIQHAKVPGYLASCDLFLCPSQLNKDKTMFFGSPTKLFEYMSMEKPIVCSNIGQMKKILTKQSACLVQPQDTAGFVLAIEKIMKKSKKEQAAIGYDLRSCVLKKYSWNKHVQRIKEFVR